MYGVQYNSLFSLASLKKFTFGSDTFAAWSQPDGDLSSLHEYSLLVILTTDATIFGFGALLKDQIALGKNF